MRDNDRCPAPGQPVGGGENRGFGRRVERRGRLVQQQDVRVDQFRPGERDQLPLAGRQVPAPFVDRMPESAAESGDRVEAPTALAAASTSASDASGRP